MLSGIIIPFITIGLAELGDKTQLAVFCLSTKTKKHWLLIAGAMFGFLIADGLAILFGEMITNWLPAEIIKLISGTIFIIFGIISLLSKAEAENCDNVKTKNPFISSFVMILLGELGDKTQITSMLFASKYNVWMVFIGVMLALFCISLASIYLGKIIMKKVDKKQMTIFAGILFILIGIWTILF